jgi:hypothetical protein
MALISNRLESGVLFIISSIFTNKFLLAPKTELGDTILITDPFSYSKPPMTSIRVYKKEESGDIWISIGELEDFKLNFEDLENRFMNIPTIPKKYKRNYLFHKAFTGFKDDIFGSRRESTTPRFIGYHNFLIEGILQLDTALIGDDELVMSCDALGINRKTYKIGSRDYEQLSKDIIFDILYTHEGEDKLYESSDSLPF